MSLTSHEPPVAMAALMPDYRKIWGTPDKPAEPSPPFDLAAYIRRQRVETFKRLCPLEFQAPIKREKLTKPDAWDEADLWNGSYPGLWLWGNDTGDAKTRMLWRQFGRLHVERACTVMRSRGLTLAEEYHDAVQRAVSATYYRDLFRVNVVMLDDVDKMELPDPEHRGFRAQEAGDRNGRMLRELFDHFYEQHTPVLVTSNESIAWFAERLGPSTERRMREVCREVAF